MTSFLTGCFLIWVQRDLAVKEHQSCEICAVFKHCQATGHKINPHNAKGLSNENNNMKHCVREAIATKQRKPSLNKDKELDLPSIYELLLRLCNNLAVT